MISGPVWDDGQWVGFPTLSGSVEADLCVVGLGGSGVAAIAQGLEMGLSVVGLDAGLVAGEAAGRNGGFLLAGMPLFYHHARNTYGAAKARLVYEQTLAELERVYSDGGGRNTGSLRVAGSDDELIDIREEFEALTSDGFSVDLYEGPEGSGMLIPYDGVCNPMRRIRDLSCGMADSGAALYENSRVTELGPNLVRTPFGEVHTEFVVVAVDGGLERVVKGIDSDVKTASLQMLATAPIERILSRPVYTDYGFTYYQQLTDGSLALGGRREAHVERSWSHSKELIPEIQNDLDGILATWGVTATVTHRWAGNAAFTEDSRPIYREVHDRVVAVGAYCGHGNILGPVYARQAVRQLHSGGPIEAPL